MIGDSKMWLEIGSGGVDFSLSVLGLDVVLGLDLATIVGLVVIVAGLRLRKVLRDKKRKLK
jgi:hypothetical protein